MTQNAKQTSESQFTGQQESDGFQLGDSPKGLTTKTKKTDALRGKERRSIQPSQRGSHYRI
jgi:hypothetical protein